MRTAFFLLLSVATAAPALAEVDAATAERSRLEVAPALAAMGAAANRHDVEGHVGFYAHDPSVTLIFNGTPIVGWENIYDKQRQWWKDGKTDVVYTVEGKPDYRVLAADIVISTLFMKSRRTKENGEVSEGEFVVSSIWQKRVEGWRVIYSHESTTH